VDKRTRHRAILELVEEQVVGSQEELRQLLRRRGWDVTQSTLSRDLRELRLARIPTADGVRYASPDSRSAEEPRFGLDDVLPRFFASVDGVGELLVLKTIPGGAQPVAEALDSQEWSEIVGTIGGENTILIVCRSAAARDKVEKRLRKAAKD
jgi:transcriptional regulator of arginine metabolism